MVLFLFLTNQLPISNSNSLTAPWPDMPEMGEAMRRALSDIYLVGQASSQEEQNQARWMAT